MGRHVFYTKITPLPSNIPRLLALDLLHSHDEFIRLNPLVTNVKPIDAPRNAEGDEYFSSWYEISEIMKLTGVKVKYDFKGCFHNQSWGMQSHVFAPLGIEFRNKYRVGGNQPGEPREDRELGVNTPQDGLYLREDISFTCNTFMAGFVKKGMQDASQVMIDRMKRKAELLDEGKLYAMFENGQLKTSKPTQPPPAPVVEGERPTVSPTTSSGPGSPPPFDSPNLQSSETFKSGYQNYNSLAGRDTSHSSSRNSYMPPWQQPGYTGPDQKRPISNTPSQPQLGSPKPEQTAFVGELEGSSYYYPQAPSKPQSSSIGSGQQAFRSELPGDTTLYPGVQPNPPPPTGIHPAFQNRSSQMSAADGQRSSSLYENEQRGSMRSDSYQTTQTTTNTSTSDDPHRSSINEWQRRVQNDTPIDENYYRNSRNSHGLRQGEQQQPQQQHPSLTSSEPDSQRLSNLSLGSQQQTQPGAMEKCPVCHNFEGDEPAINHHITLTHGMR